MEKTVFATLSLVTLLSLSAGVFAESISVSAVDDTTPYATSDVLHTFDNMNLFVTLDDDYHMIVNETAANIHPEISDLDLAIAYDFAVHSDEIIDAGINGPVGHVNELSSENHELVAAINDLENGKFSSIFNHDEFQVHTTSLKTGIPIIYPTYIGIQNIDAFGTSNIVPVYHGAFGTICGGGPHDPHKLIRDTSRSFDYKYQVRSELIELGYVLVPQYATVNYGDDYAKTASISWCPDGFMRNQAIIWPNDGKFYYRSHGPEPNPDVLNYVWGYVPWWGAYVYWWHMNY